MAQRTLEKLFSEVDRLGASRTAHDLALKVINAVVPFKILKGIVVSRVGESFLTCPAGYRAGFLAPNTIRHFARDPSYEMSDAFLDEALSKGDECFAICDGDTLAAYGWYARSPTRIDPPEFLLHFGRDYVYMYKGFTHVRYRGQRLHAIGMSLALQSYLSRGFAGLVSYVESNNFDSLRSCERMGYEVFGTIVVARILGHFIRRSSAGCRRIGFRLEQAPSSVPGLKVTSAA